LNQSAPKIKIASAWGQRLSTIPFTSPNTCPQPPERFSNGIMHFRRIAKHKKTALSFAAMLSLVAAAIWLR
jgi:hypothetical protein